MKWLVYGGQGWIGGQVVRLLESDKDNIVVLGKVRVDNERELEKELVTVEPDRVVSLIGRTHGAGINTIDYLEQPGKLVENVKDNLYAPLVLAFLCTKYGYHFTYLGTGCIFNGYEGNTGTGYDEDARPDFVGSSYSTVKGFTDRLLKFFDSNVLVCRIRMPISDETHPRNFITKILNYQKICSIPNSMTVLPELLPMMIDMASKKRVGTINLTNPGLVSHNEILEMVKEYHNPDLVWDNFTLEEQNKVLASGRSNNLLNTDKLEDWYPHVMPIKDSIKYHYFKQKN